MRAATASLLAAAIVCIAAAPAGATNIRRLEASVTPNKAGSTVAMSLRLLTSTDNGLAPDSGAHDDIFLAKGITYNGAAVPSCRSAALVASGPSGCPRGSIVGGGTIVGLIRTGCENPPMSSITGSLVQTIALTIVNANRGRSLLAYLKNDVIGATFISINIRRAPSPYGLKFTFNVPDLLLQPVHNVCASLADVKINIARRTVTVRKRVRGRTVSVRQGLLRTGTCPRNRQWPFRDAVTFVRGNDIPGTDRVDRTPTQKTAGSTTVRCRS